MASETPEPNTAPRPERWYNLSLGSTFKEQSSTKFCTFRYEFKPASIDKSHPGSLLKNKDNRATVEFQNNQPGKAKLIFEGSTEDCKDNDGILFFDGQTFRLERLHRSVKRLRHLREHGDASITANAASSASGGAGVEPRSPPPGKTSKATQPLSKTVAHSAHVEIERMDVGVTESPGPRPTRQSNYHHSLPHDQLTTPSPDSKSSWPEDNLNDGASPAKTFNEMHAALFGFEANETNQDDTDEEIADVAASDDDDDMASKGPNAAEALRAQANGDDGQKQLEQQQQEHHRASSSSDTSGSSSSTSGSSSSGGSSSRSDGSENDSACSGGNVDVDT